MSDSEIWRIAKLLIEEHGSSAVGHAAAMAINCHTTGDEAGEARWLKAIDVIRELLYSRPSSDRQAH